MTLASPRNHNEIPLNISIITMSRVSASGVDDNKKTGGHTASLKNVEVGETVQEERIELEQVFGYEQALPRVRLLILPYL